jgi:ubiquinone/menaquinone biosynthesis C-methylase UbiE/uncharacterized protein YbaR (Trm112 family)
MSITDDGVLVCPDCHGPLAEERDVLVCGGCGATWPPEDGFPKLFREQRIRGTDRFMRLFYNGLPALHDPLMRHFLPWFQRDAPEPEFRDGYMRRIALASLRPREDGARPRILEVGIGAGGNIPPVHRDLPAGLEVDYWGLDLARGMLGQCRKRVRRDGWNVRLLLGDAHRLPFRDHTFDRVFHVGAAGSYRAPAVALAEMARVARPGTPIVVVDEQLDRSRRNTLRDHVAFRLLTFYDRDPHCPSELLPPGATGVREEQVSRFYYCLTFEMPATPAAS